MHTLYLFNLLIYSYLFPVKKKKKKTCLELSVNYPTWESNKADSSKLPCFPTISPPIYGGDLEISNQTQLFLLFIDNISKF